LNLRQQTSRLKTRRSTNPHESARKRRRPAAPQHARRSKPNEAVFILRKTITIASMHTIEVRSREREELVEFTDQVQTKLKESGEREGVVVLYVQHTTAGLTVNENADPDVPRDMLHALRTLIPQHGMGFRHGEENSDAHIKASLVGSSVTVPFKDGKLLLGRWQGIFLCEFDGGRKRQVIMMLR
ncbi:MAG: secondary thiamine-phosphate synthase enzyme YjbQ, partial [Pyrinomonadaceae bacterium]